MSEVLDILIIGAGLSGIGTASQLARQFPHKRMAILERRQSIGGTWDLFRYPGIRSDSDMFSFGYKFRPWNELKVLADGPAIRQYIRDTARESGVEQNIRFGMRTTRAEWCSRKRLWTVSALHEPSGEMRSYSTKYLVSCTGYYNHDAGFLPRFPGVERFKGQCIHPQQWPENLDYAGKKVVVIGSGATAVTLVPAMAGTAGHVTMRPTCSRCRRSTNSPPH
jgi:monooxygenase